MKQRHAGMKPGWISAGVVALSAVLVAGPAGAATLSSSTLADLKTAMGGEAFASAKYLEYARHAAEADKPHLAALFRRTAAEERQAHFAEEARLAGLVGSDEQNLRDAAGGEAYEVDTMYRRFAEEAAAAGDSAAAARFEDIRSDEAAHRDAYRAALDALASGRGDAAVPDPPVVKPADRSTAPVSESTRQNLLTAMHGEALAHAKYLLYADHARQSGHPRLAALFERTAAVEREEHFAEEGVLAGLVSSDRDNLREAAQGENYEAETMYPEFAARADRAGDQEAADRFREVARDEARHRDAFNLALRTDPAA